MIKVIMILMLFGVPPMVGEREGKQFKTMAECQKALPALDREAVKAFAESDPSLKRGKNFAFDLKCFEAPKDEPKAKPDEKGKV